jgi:hypothetical protein
MSGDEHWVAFWISGADLVAGENMAWCWSPTTSIYPDRTTGLIRPLCSIGEVGMLDPGVHAAPTAQWRGRPLSISDRLERG